MSVKNTILFLLFFLVGCGPSTLDYEKGKAEDLNFITWEDCSAEIEDHPCNFKLKNQDNEVVELYDLYGKNILLDFSTMWCGPCHIAAAEVNLIKQEFPEIEHVTILIDNEVGEPPTIDDVNKWKNYYNIRENILMGDRTLIDTSREDAWPIRGWPSFFYINDEMILEHQHTGYSYNTVSQNLEMMLD